MNFANSVLRREREKTFEEILVMRTPTNNVRDRILEKLKMCKCSREISVS